MNGLDELLADGGALVASTSLGPVIVVTPWSAAFAAMIGARVSRATGWSAGMRAVVEAMVRVSGWQMGRAFVASTILGPVIAVTP